MCGFECMNTSLREVSLNEPASGARMEDGERGGRCLCGRCGHCLCAGVVAGVRACIVERGVLVEAVLFGIHAAFAKSHFLKKSEESFLKKMILKKNLKRHFRKMDMPEEGIEIQEEGMVQAMHTS
jgi:hypothetical protein